MTPQVPFIELVPTAVLTSARDQLVIEIGMAAGPSFVAQRTIKFEPKIAIAEALLRLESFRGTLRVGRILLDDGRTWFFDPIGFRRETRMEDERKR